MNCGSAKGADLIFSLSALRLVKNVKKMEVLIIVIEIRMFEGPVIS